MKNQIICLFISLLASCNQEKHETAFARKSAKQSLVRLKEEVSSLRSGTINRHKRLSLNAMLVSINGPLMMGLSDLKNPKNESTTRAIISALKVEFDVLKQEVDSSLIKKHNLATIKNELNRLEKLLEMAQSRLEKYDYHQTELTQKWKTWVEKAIMQETLRTRNYAQIRQAIIENSKTKYTDSINRLINSRNEYFNLLTQLVGEETLSDETSAKLKYAAIRSIQVDTLLQEQVTSSRLSFLHPNIVAQVEEDDEKCKIKSVIGDQAGTMTGTIATGPTGGNPPSSSSEGDNIKCKLGSTVIPLPTPKTE